MLHKANFDIKALAKKHRIDVSQVIMLWKRDKHDMEISESLGVDPWKLSQLRNEMIKTRMQQRARKLNWH